MTQTTRNGCHLARRKLDFTVFEFDHKPAFDNKKCFVGVRVRVPMIRLGADPYNVVVYIGYRVIVIGFRVGRF